MLALEEAGGLLEGAEIDGPGTGVDEAGEGWRADGITEDAVFISFGDGGVAGMEGAWYGFRLQSPDGGGQGAVEGAEQVFRGDAGLEWEAGDLAEGVNACVCAA